MISVRFADTRRGGLPISSSEYVQVTTDPTLIMLEAEKNRPEDATAVDRALRPQLVEAWQHEQWLFRLLSVETRSGCNYECSFCPVARSVDPRPPGELDDSLLARIADEMGQLNFAGRIALFGNNEPLLDRRIVRIVRLFRDTCPKASLRILSNGTRVTVDLVRDLFAAGLATLVINNYTDGRRLITPVRTLLRSSSELSSFDIRVSVRDRHEVLTSRAGNAPNKPHPDKGPFGFCALPFIDLHVSYTGMVNLCCFDAHGQVVAGNVAESSLVDIWRSATLEAYRQQLGTSVRRGLCAACDFDGYGDPEPDNGTPLLRSDLRTLVARQEGAQWPETI